MTIPYSDFEKVDMRVGRIVEVEDFARARKPSYRVTVDLGPEIGTRRSSVGAKADYTIEEMQGRLVVAVVNFEPRNVAGFMSEVLILGAVDADGRLSLLVPDGDPPLGTRIS